MMNRMPLGYFDLVGLHRRCLPSAQRITSMAGCQLPVPLFSCVIRRSACPAQVSVIKRFIARIIRHLYVHIRNPARNFQAVDRSSWPPVNLIHGSGARSATESAIRPLRLPDYCIKAPEESRVGVQSPSLN